VLLGAFRRTGADPPFGNPSRDHGVAMEGTFWRFTDAARGRVAVVLLGECRGPAGRWSLVGVAAHPGGEVRWAIGDDLLEAGEGRLRVRLDGASVDATWSADRPWPRSAFGALGPAQMVPWLHQYWHPHLLMGSARGSLTLDGEAWSLDGATVYSERNWGDAFAGHWWWGQAHDLGDGAVCAAFAGGRVLGLEPTALVVALEDRLIRRSPPLRWVSASTEPGSWRIRAGGVELEAEADPAEAHVLPVPIPAEHRAELRSHQHLAGRLALTVRRRGGIVFRGETELAGLERGVP
jgi:tocopherol cyclase